MPTQGRTKWIHVASLMAFVASSTRPARRRLMRSVNPRSSAMRHRLSIFGAIIFGIPLLTLAALMVAQLLWFDSLHEISPSSLTSVSGLVERTQFIPRSKGPSVYDVWVQGYSYPFRFDAHSALETLKPGAEFRIGILPAELEKPRIPNFGFGDPFYAALEGTLPNGTSFSRVAAHNSNIVQTRRILPWLIPILVCLASLMSSRWFFEKLAASRLPHSSKHGGPLVFRLLKPPFYRK